MGGERKEGCKLFLRLCSNKFSELTVLVDGYCEMYLVTWSSSWLGCWKYLIFVEMGRVVRKVPCSLA